MKKDFQSTLEKHFGKHFTMDDHRYLSEAQGFLELGMLEEANIAKPDDLILLERGFHSLHVNSKR